MKKTSYKKPFLITFIIVATELIGFGLIVPVLPQLALKFDASPFQMGFLLAAYSLAQFIAAPILGSLSDRFGRKPLLVISKFGTMIGYLIMAASTGYVGFLFARLLDGFTGGNISVARAYLADVTTPEDRPKGMAIIGISFGLGFILGPALGGLLYSDVSGHKIAALVAAGCSLLAALLTILLLEEPQTRIKSGSAFSGLKAGISKLANPTILILFAVQFIYMAIFSGFEVTLSIFTHYYHGFSVKQNSWLFVYAGLLGLIVQGGLARRAPKNLKRAAVFGLLIMSVGCVGAVAIPTVSGLFLFIAAMAIGVGLVNVYMPSLVAKFTSDEDRGTLMGLYEGISSLSRIIGPLVIYTSFMGALVTGYTLFAMLLSLAAALLVLGIRLK